MSTSAPPHDDSTLAIVLLAAYCALLVFTVGLLLRLLVRMAVTKKEGQKTTCSGHSWKPRHTFLVLIMLLAALRIANFSLLLADPLNRPWYFWALFNAAALAYLTIFTELILFWARMHDVMRPSVVDGSTRFTDKQRRIVQGLVLLVAWAAYCGVFALYFFMDFPQFTQIVSYVTCGFFAISALFFALYGSLIYRRVMQMPLRTDAVNTRIRRVLAVAVIMTLAFMTRAVLNAALPSLLQHGNLTDLHQWILYTSVFLVMEVVPLFLVELLVVVPFSEQKNTVRSTVRQQYANHYVYQHLGNVPKSEPIN